MPRYWCVNFDPDACANNRNYILEHGIKEKLWLMQYQYSHGGHTYQGHQNQTGITSRSWNIAGTVSESDLLVAYMQPSTFYAIGKVVEPVHRERHTSARRYLDSIDRTVTTHSHMYSQHSQHAMGVVRYTWDQNQADQLVFYEDFTDPWVLSVSNPYSKQREKWMYAQRIDVACWVDCVPSGVVVQPGLAAAANPPPHFSAIVEITEDFFERVRTALRS